VGHQTFGSPNKAVLRYQKYQELIGLEDHGYRTYFHALKVRIT